MWGRFASAIALVLAMFGTLAGPARASSEMVHVDVPYRSQLDGRPYGPANCGPTAVGMALDAFGVSASSWDLRVAAMKLQGTWGAEYRDEWGVFIYNLAQVVEQQGLKTSGLYRREGIKLDVPNHWTPDDVRAQLDRGHVVIAQLRFSAMPGRAGLAFAGDHYVVIHGRAGQDFIYSDPLPQSGGGPDRRISGEALRVAMEQSELPGSAFAVWR